MKDSVESLITKFQNACLEKLEQVQRAACARIEQAESERNTLAAQLAAHKSEFSRELGAREAEIARLRSGAEHLIDWSRRHSTGNVEDSERVSLLTRQTAEKDARIENLLTLLGDRDKALAANDPEPVDETIATLQGEISGMKSEAERLQTERDEEDEAHEKEIVELRTEVKELEEQLEEKTPDADALADAVHNFMRSERLLPANLDTPMTIVPAVYRDGMARAVREALP